MTLILLLVLGGLAVFSVMLTARWVDSLLWRQQLVSYHLEVPRGLTHDQVSGWLAALGALTRHIPVVIEIAADGNGIRHFLTVPRCHAKAVLNQARAMLPGVRAELAPDYPVNESAINAAGELRSTSTSHPLGQDRAADMASAFLAALQPCQQVPHMKNAVGRTAFRHRARIRELPAD